MDLIEEGEVGDPTRTSAMEQAFNTDIERLVMDSNAHVTMFKSGRAMSEPNQDILEYWNRFRFGGQSKLADLACDLLVIPASSVPSERMFSIAGILSSGIVCFWKFSFCIMMFLGKMYKISAKCLEARVLLRCNDFD